VQGMGGIMHVTGEPDAPSTWSGCRSAIAAPTCVRFKGIIAALQTRMASGLAAGAVKQ
jgi:crotonobetainyl-CoA:carnitine CoA-transferase CaiB-like acyl-CoA transferase